MSTAAATDVAVTKPAQIQTRSGREVVLQERLTELCGQAQRCVVDSEDAAERATTLAVAIRNSVKALEEDKLSLTRPLKSVAKDIESRYNSMVAPAEPALRRILGSDGELTKWNLRKKREAEEAAARARAEAEATRLAEAQRAADEAARLKAAGDAESAKVAQQQADDALNAAVDVPADIVAPPVVTRGTYGGSSGTAKVGKFEITDMAALIAWETENVRRGVGLRVLCVGEVELGKKARAAGAKPTIPGVRFFYEETSKVWG